MNRIIQGQCEIVLQDFPENYFDSCVTDSPYGLKFMGKKWDYQVPSVEIWQEVLRVMKPGAHLLSFGGTRTYHRMVVNIEDAGFEIRDQLQWIYGSGFPKSLDVSKAIDKQAGAERERIGEYTRPDGKPRNWDKHAKFTACPGEHKTGAGQNRKLSAPATPEAAQWSGWGTALKPANEPICLARKPLTGTVAENVMMWGTGALNIDGCRVGTHEMTEAEWINKGMHRSTGNTYGDHKPSTTPLPAGRFPSNVILDEEAARMLDLQSGTLKSGVMRAGTQRTTGGGYHGNFPGCATEKDTPGDIGGASRFFYCAKASREERNSGLDGMEETPCGMMEDDNYPIKTGSGNLRNTKRQNHHPTVKPYDLIRYLCRLITPPKGIILDPFAGSGTTGLAATDEGFHYVLIEKEAEFHEISVRRNQAGPLFEVAQ